MSLDEKLDNAQAFDESMKKDFARVMMGQSMLSALRKIRDVRDEMLRNIGNSDFYSDEGRLKAQQAQAQAKGLTHALTLLDELGTIEEKEDVG